MGRLWGKLRRSGRLCVQVCFTALTNGYVQGFAGGKIYTGPLKAVCVPGLNCYSCPGAFGACPMGSLQAALNSRNLHAVLYVAGFLAAAGAFFGRAVCGFLCPFGLVQDLVYKIPVPGKRKKLPGHRLLKWLKYGILVLFGILLPLFALDAFGVGLPWFCKYVCPAGTLGGGVPLVLLQRGLRAAVGFLYAWKLAILAALLGLSVFVYRPFCKYLCPLGAAYSLFNGVSLCRYEVDGGACTRCGACARACKMDITPWKTPNNLECIRCGDCARACPHGAIRTAAPLRKRTEERHDS